MLPCAVSSFYRFRSNSSKASNEVEDRRDSRRDSRRSASVDADEIISLPDDEMEEVEKQTYKMKPGVRP